MDPNLETRISTLEQKIDEIAVTVTKIRRAQQTAMWIRAGYWVFLVLLGLGAFYFVQPYIESLRGAYSFSGGNMSEFGSLIEQFKDVYSEQ